VYTPGLDNLNKPESLRQHVKASTPFKSGKNDLWTSAILTDLISTEDAGTWAKVILRTQTKDFCRTYAVPI